LIKFIYVWNKDKSGRLTEPWLAYDGYTIVHDPLKSTSPSIEFIPGTYDPNYKTTSMRKKKLHGTDSFILDHQG